MRCETARVELSVALDGEQLSVAPEELEAHVRECASCAQFDARLREVRSGLRIERMEAVPDVASTVITAVTAVTAEAAIPPSPSPLRSRPARRLLPAAAVFVVSALAGAALTLVGDGTGSVAGAHLADRVVGAQRAVHSLDARLVVVERNWHPQVPERRFEGRLVYDAPERLTLTLEDRTSYPSRRWVPNDVTLVVDESTRWTQGPRDCPASGQPVCTPRAPRVHLTTGREPFDEAAPVPLELVTPVDSFLGSGTTPVVGTDRVAGRAALRVRVAAGQVAELLDALRPAGNLRAVHPSDVADLWLDDELMVPLRLRVVASDDPDRRRWARARGYGDSPGDTVLEVVVASVAVNGDVSARSFSPAPEGAVTVAAGFTSEGIEPAVRPRNLPAGFSVHDVGTVRTDGGPVVSVATWADGRAWLKVAATREWPGGRLFGDLGPLVRRVTLGGAGVGYQAEDGSKVALHGDGVDVVVTGSLPPATLRAVAAGLGITGRAVPADWQEAASATVDQARRALGARGGALLYPTALDGFGPPAVAVSAGRVAIGFAGPGDRGFLLVQVAGDVLPPPFDPDVIALELRDGTARWSPARGELEWVEAGVVVSLTSRTMALGELLAVAASMEPR